MSLYIFAKVLQVLMWLAFLIYFMREMDNES